MSSSKLFHYVLGLWCHIMWHVMWLWCHVPLHHPKGKRKEKEKLLVSKHFITVIRDLIMGMGWRRRVRRKLSWQKNMYRCHEAGYWCQNCLSVAKTSDKKSPERLANLTVDSLQSLGDCEVGRLMIAIVDEVETMGVLLYFISTSHMFIYVHGLRSVHFVSSYL